MIKLSYILPCFNVDRFIIDCLLSIYQQDIPETEFEVICVDDCSTDSTLTLLEEFTICHKNCQVIRHSTNQSVGGARNSGLKAAQGKYVWFIDPDDLTYTNYLNKLIDSTLGRDLDVLMFNYDIADEHLTSFSNDKTFVDSNVVTGQDFVREYPPSNLSDHCMVWRCLFKKDFLMEKNLFFPLMRKAEDVCFLWNVLIHAKRVASISSNHYIYRSNSYSIASQGINASVFFSERIMFACEILNMLNDNTIIIIPTIQEKMRNALRWCANSNLGVLIKLDDLKLKEYYSEIKKHRREIARIKPYMNRRNNVLFSSSLCFLTWKFRLRLLTTL